MPAAETTPPRGLAVCWAQWAAPWTALAMLEVSDTSQRKNFAEDPISAANVSPASDVMSKMATLVLPLLTRSSTHALPKPDALYGRRQMWGVWRKADRDALTRQRRCTSCCLSSYLACGASVVGDGGRARGSTDLGPRHVLPSRDKAYRHVLRTCNCTGAVPSGTCIQISTPTDGTPATLLKYLGNAQCHLFG